MSISVLLVDDHVLMLMGLKELLEKESDLQVEDALSDPTALASRIKFSHPDVAVLDVRLKSQNGIELTQMLKEQFPYLKVVLLSGYAYDEYIEAAIQAGADAYVSKEKSNTELITTIRQVYRGKKLFPDVHPGRSGEALTPKEREILALIADELTTAEISDRLSISKRTVEYHIASILRKLDADSRIGAVVNGIKKGLLNV
ncbi:response regulator transcription factor [Sporolactobacillus sp. THM7-7]|nr:response regulator transcription factor [Sporolactobacillus sp. THM7-7]